MWLGNLRLLDTNLSQLDLVFGEGLPADGARERLPVLLGELDEVLVAVLVHDVSFPAGQFHHLLVRQHLNHAEGTLLNALENQSAGQRSLKTLSNAADVHASNGVAKVGVLHRGSSAEPDILWLVVVSSNSGGLHGFVELLLSSVQVLPVLFPGCLHTLVSPGMRKVGLRFCVLSKGVVQFESPFASHELLEVAGDQLIRVPVGLDASRPRIPLVINLDRQGGIYLLHICIAHASATAAQYLEQNKDADSRAVEDGPLEAQQDQAQPVSRECVFHAIGGNWSEFFAR